MDAPANTPELYTCLDKDLAPVLVAACPVCGDRPSLWQFIEKGSTASKVVMCNNGAELWEGQGGLASEGCLLYMPPQDFYRATKREAIAHWNRYADALTKLRSTR